MKSLLLALTIAATLTGAHGAPIANSDWTGIRAAHDAWRNRITVQPDGTHVARNPSQGWTIAFDDRGFLATPDGADWTWGLELAKRDPANSATADENRLAIRRSPALSEWFVNHPHGLQQGWTLTKRPAASDGDPLLLSLAVRGSLAPTVTPDVVQFTNPAGATILTYDGLLAWDADGRTLPTRFVPRAKGFAIEVDDRDARYPVTIDPVAQQAFFKASNTDAGDRFGGAVAISGDTAIVGATGEESTAEGIGGDQTNNGLNSAGAAYVFVRSGTTWIQQAYLKASNTDDSDNFGAAVAISGDTAVVGANLEDSDSNGVNGNQNNSAASAAGAAYVFVRTGAAWSQQAYLKALNSDANDEFGSAVAISGDTIVVGARFEDSDSNFINGNQLNSAAPSAGAAYVFARVGNLWSQQAYLKASNSDAGDRFGTAVSISGDTVAVGAPLEDSSATGIGGDQTDNASAGSGAAYVFIRSGTTWTQQAYAKSTNTDGADSFGTALAISGDSLVVGAPFEDSGATGINGDQTGNLTFDAGAAYAFVRSGTTWFPETYLKASNAELSDQFGRSVALSGANLVVGAIFEDSIATGVDGEQADNTTGESGAAYLFSRSGTTWFQRAYLKSANADPDDEFGGSVAISGDTAIIGATREDSNAAGINNPLAINDNTASDSGAAYVFFIPPTTPPAIAPDLTRPRVRVQGRRRVESTRRRIVFRGQATDNVSIARVEFKIRGQRGGFKPTRGPGPRWRAVVRPDPDKRTTLVKIRAFDAAGNRSKVLKLRVIRR